MSFGEEIRRERELRQISLREVAHATKINLRYLEAMERNDFSYLPGGLFNRAFVRAYCEHIGVDAESMVNAYLLEEQSQAGAARRSGDGLLRGSAVQSADVAGSEADAEVEQEQARRRSRRVVWVLIGLALVVVAAVAAFLLLGGSH